ncbi:hypothetical protein [Ruegeria sp. TM1040]|nr:hypothetical protein [Ruegeria sp. TM1040]
MLRISGPPAKQDLVAALLSDGDLTRMVVQGALCCAGCHCRGGTGC